MQAAGIPVESSKGEAWPGQHEINFRYADALTTADDHVDLQERRQGDRAPERLLDHVHGEARPHVDRQLVPYPLEPLARRRERLRRRRRRSSGSSSPGRSRAPRAGALLRAERQLVQALRGRQLGADDARLGARQPHVRLPDRRATAASQRVETRIPGGDVNPYLAFAAMIAAGLHGIEQGLELPPPLEGNAYESDAERFPSTLREAIAALERGTVARAAFGDEVVDHYLNYARTSSSACSTRSSPATSASGCSSVAEARHRHHDLRRLRRRWGVLGQRGRAAPAPTTCA